MTSRIEKYLAAMALTIAVVGCASKPPHYDSISSTADPAQEIERTEMMLKDAKDHQIDSLSPENFTDARKALDKAKKKQAEGASSADVLEQVSYSRGWLSEANTKSELLQTVMKDITDARTGAMKAGASDQYPKEWKRANKELEDIAIAVEKGNMNPAEKNGDNVIARFRELEILSVTKNQLGIADENIQSAKLKGADKEAPKTYGLATMKRDNVARMIKADPRNQVAIRRAAEDATRESMHLVDVITKVNAGNTEDLVLTAERQQRTISSLRSEHSSTEQELRESQKELSEAEKERQRLAQQQSELSRKQAELEKTQALVKKAEALRRQFKPNEAEVYAEGGKLMVRLKSLQFPSGQAKLGRKNEALLKKVETALADVEPSKITIQGHTDTTGRPETNQVLSEKRAQAVGDFLISEGKILGNKIQSVGKGSEDPISDNATARGRAENRRIDMIIETE